MRTYDRIYKDTIDMHCKFRCPIRIVQLPWPDTLMVVGEEGIRVIERSELSYFLGLEERLMQ